MTQRRSYAAAVIVAASAVLACGGTEPTPPPPPPPNVEITVSPALNGAFSGHSDTHQLTATITDTLGNPLTGVTPLWSVFPAAVGVTVSQAGLITVASLAPVIDYSIRATVEGITGSAILRMLPRPLGKLYFTRGSPDQQLFVKNLENDLDAVQLTNGTGLLSGYDVDPVAAVIIFSRITNQQADLFRMNLDGSGVTALTTDGAANQFPVIYPPTNEVYFSSREPGTTITQIYKMATDGSGRTQVTTGTQNKLSPAFSSDGQRLAWVERFPSFNNEIVTADITGADPVRLTDLASNDFGPFWFSDSRLMWGALIANGLDVLVSDVPSVGAPVNLTARSGSDGPPSRGCLANTITMLSDRAGLAFEAFHLDLSNGLVARYVLPTPGSIISALRVCQ